MHEEDPNDVDVANIHSFLLCDFTMSNNGGRSGTSSLQRAIAESSRGKRKGDFESCFADGLDFSEFESSTSKSLERTTTLPSVSHSATLLRIKQVESQTRLQNDNEETQLVEAMRRKVEQSKAPTSNKADDVLKAPPPSSMHQEQSCFDLVQQNVNKRSRNGVGLINALVVGMHGMERNDEPQRKLKPVHRSHKSATKCKPSNIKRQTLKGKQPAVKVNKRRKH
jgi:hypothetical protein